MLIFIIKTLIIKLNFKEFLLKQPLLQFVSHGLSITKAIYEVINCADYWTNSPFITKQNQNIVIRTCEIFKLLFI